MTRIFSNTKTYLTFHLILLGLIKPCNYIKTTEEKNLNFTSGSKQYFTLDQCHPVSQSVLSVIFMTQLNRTLLTYAATASEHFPDVTVIFIKISFKIR